MRIVIDLQGAQSDSRHRGIGRYSLALAEAMIRENRGKHYFIIALNGLLSETIEPIRARFDGLLNQADIRVWTAAGPVSAVDTRNTWRRRAAELEREAFLLSLEPDVVHISSLFEGFYDNAVQTVGLLPRSYCTAVTFYDAIPLLQSAVYLEGQPGFEPLYREKISYLRSSDIFFAISESSRAEAIGHVEIPPEHVVSIAAAVDERFRPLKLDSRAEAAIRRRFRLNKMFIMYSGASDERKNHLRLIKAFSMLPPNLRARYQLALVGRIPPANRHKFESQVMECGLSCDDVVITGGVSDVDLHALYSLCEFFVFPSIHEGFGLPALEAMSCGTPVIGSNTTSIPEVIGLPDALFNPFDEASIADKMCEVIIDDAFRQRLRQHAVPQAANFSWQKSAKKAVARMEQWYADTAPRNITCDSILSSDLSKELVARISKFNLANTSLDDWAATAKAIAQNHPRPSTKKLMLDVSELVQRDSRSGIQRVVRAVLAELLARPPSEVQIVLVRSTPGVNGLRTAADFTKRFLGLPEIGEEDHIVEPHNGDILLGLDLNHGNIIGHEYYLRSLRDLGVSIYFVIYDLIPITLPTVYPTADDLSNLHSCWLDVVQQHDGVICISRSVADEFMQWVDAFGTQRLRALKIGFFHLGADMAASKPTRGFEKGAKEVRMQLTARTTFLSVGTIEPRKGQVQTVRAFEQLWSEGVDINLVLVGKQGWDGSKWSIEATAKMLDAHPERGRRLFWLDAISDEYLEQVYAESDCIIAASLAEGFGLPIIEAARHGLPIIARDLPVFREVAGGHADYFDGLEPKSIADAVRNWIARKEQGVIRSSESIVRLTWRESTQMLMDVISKHHWYREWMSGDELRFRSTDQQFGSPVGKRGQREIITSGKAGILLHGPYVALESGSYRITIRGRISEHSSMNAYVEVAINRGTTSIKKAPIHRADSLLGANIASFDFSIADNCTDLEVKICVDETVELGVSAIEIRPLTAPNYSSELQLLNPLGSLASPN